MPLAADVSVPNVATVTMTGLPPTTILYNRPPSSPPAAAEWSAGSGVTLTTFADGILMEATGTTGYMQRSIAAASGSRRVRVLAQLLDPESPPVEMWVTAGDGSIDPLTPGRMVSADPVWVDGIHTAAIANVRVYARKAAGTAEAELMITAVHVYQLGPGTSTAADFWTLTRTDSNGAGRVLADWKDATVPDTFGDLVVVDREASLVGDVTWQLLDGAGSVVTSVTDQLANDAGHAVLHRVHDPSSPLLTVPLVTLSTRRTGRAVPMDVAGDPYPVIAQQPLSSRAGTFALYLPTIDAAEAVADQLATGDVVQLRQPYADQLRIDAYLVATDVDVAAAGNDTDRWQVTGSYVETRRGVA